MAVILCIESSTKTCSVALSSNGTCVAIKEEHGVYSHAGKLTLFVEEVLKQYNSQLSNLDAVAVSIGPGSYTGLRIGLSVAKGFCYALDLPLITISTLQSLAAGIRSNGAKEHNLLLPTLDARREEAYIAIYNQELKELLAPQAKVLSPDTLAAFGDARLLAGGNGADKTKRLVGGSAIDVLEDLNCSAKYMTELSQHMYEQKAFSDVAYTEPAYLKPFFSNKG